MGLDMYLRANRYLGAWNHSDAKEREGCMRVLKALSLDSSALAAGAPSVTVKVYAAYWRKANAIHDWFVKNVQGGKDECEEHEVSREMLIQLRDLCRLTLAERNPDNLRPAEGFFFGDQEVHDGAYYWDYLAETITKIDKALATFTEAGEWWFTYQSSW